MDTNTYVKVASHEATKGEFKKCLLLYSGGLDTSVMLKWIQEEYDCEVIALTINIGQTADNLDEIKAKALTLGATDAIVVDAQDEFADTLLSEAIKANADYQGGYALGCPLGRVMISKIAVREAERTGCTVIAHGCTGKGNDQVRFEGYITTLNPKIKIIAPVREWGMGRQEELAYAEKHGIPVKQKSDKPYSYDENMWANTGEGGEIEEPHLVPPLENILQWCKTPQQAPDTAEIIELDFEQGIPVALNGKKDKLSAIIHVGIISTQIHTRIPVDPSWHHERAPAHTPTLTLLSIYLYPIVLPTPYHRLSTRSVPTTAVVSSISLKIALSVSRSVVSMKTLPLPSLSRLTRTWSNLFLLERRTNSSTLWITSGLT
eukprot:TRINITY_DN3765_c0_g1_i1.p1 TRINITY_DN3765_c0_g1~~TRINITY_DN3765_c0_g1_i1.p1  ORF type:complete len:383 (-),score=64.40 TRINITY_DN3765_c0_g1_i1:396-1523(-)